MSYVWLDIHGTVSIDLRLHDADSLTLAEGEQRVKLNSGGFTPRARFYPFNGFVRGAAMHTKLIWMLDAQPDQQRESSPSNAMKVSPILESRFHRKRMAAASRCRVGSIYSSFNSLCRLQTYHLKARADLGNFGQGFWVCEAFPRESCFREAFRRSERLGPHPCQV